MSVLFLYDCNVVLFLCYTVQNLTPTVAKCSRVAICRDDNTSSFGFILRGGVNSDLSVCRPLVVTHIRSGSAADRCCCHSQCTVLLVVSLSE